MNEYFNTTIGDYKVVYSFVPKCREVKLQILGKKNPQVHLIIIRE